MRFLATTDGANWVFLRAVDQVFYDACKIKRTVKIPSQVCVQDF